MAQANKQLKTFLIFVLKFAVSAALLYILTSKIGAETIIAYLRLLNPLSFICAVGLYVFSIYISSLRWSLLINQKISKKRLFSMYMIGSFFNICLPGIIGGDAVKAYYLSREIKGIQPTEPLEDNDAAKNNPEGNVAAIASVFMDRYIGFSALMIIGIIAFPFGFGYLDKTSPNQFLIWLMPGIFFAFVATSFILFRFRIGAGVRLLLSVYEYIDLYKAKRDVIIKGLIYSLIVQISGIISVYILSIGMSFTVPILPLLIFMPIIIVISLLPISISGIGVRELSFAFFLGSTGIPSDMSVALSLSWFFSVVAASLWGFIEYLRFKVELKSK